MPVASHVNEKYVLVTSSDEKAVTVPKETTKSIEFSRKLDSSEVVSRRGQCNFAPDVVQKT